ncbi:MAG: tRNA pseudouridine(38-40) synthase TruA [Ignavibacteria bacterium]
MNNYKLHIQYDGSDYSGWQIQENSKSVQGVISDSLNVLLNEKINLIGSGRTDAGVHALEQVANFKVKKSLDMFLFTHSLNSILPRDISINKIENVYENFHSRFDARERSYLYLVSKIKSPFYYRYSLQKNEVDIYRLNETGKVFLGEHDFTSFCKKKSDVENKICNITSLRWRETGNFYLFFIRADRFLHGMVRTIIGTLFKYENTVNAGNRIKTILEAKDREAAGESVAAKGLFLYKVKY